MPVAVIVDYIDAHRDRLVDGHRLGVEPICTVLASAARQLTVEIRRVWTANLGVYGARKVCAVLHREHIDVARCALEMFMKDIGLQGISIQCDTVDRCMNPTRCPRSGVKARRVIAAIAQAAEMTVATSNTKHFEPLGVRCVNPWEPNSCH